MTFVDASEAAFGHDSQIAWRKMQKLVPADFSGNDLASVFEFWRRVIGVDVFVHWKIMEDAGVTRDTPITLKVKEIQADHLLDLILSDAGGGLVCLKWSLDRGAVIVGTSESIDSRTFSRSYKMAGFTDAQILGLPDMIMRAIDPAGWDALGGMTSSIDINDGLCVVTTSPENHLRIGHLLEDLRDDARGVVRFQKGVVKKLRDNPVLFWFGFCCTALSGFWTVASIVFGIWRLL